MMIGAIDVEYKAPDLQITSLEVLAGGNTFSTILSGSNITVNFTVRNVADAPTRVDSWGDWVGLSSDGAIGGDTTLAAPARSDVLNPDRSYTVSLSLTIPLMFNAPAAHIFVCADNGEEAHESDEGNNCARSLAILGKTADGAWGLRILPHFEWLPEAERTDRLHCRLVGDRAAPMTLRLPGLKAGAVVSRRDGGRLVRVPRRPGGGG